MRVLIILLLMVSTPYAAVKNFEEYKKEFEKNIIEINKTFTITSTDADLVQYAKTMRDEYNNHNVIGVGYEGNSREMTHTIVYKTEYVILSAYKNSNLVKNLSDKEKLTLNAAKKVVSKISKPSMDPYQKVLAAHDYIVLNVEYSKSLVADDIRSAHDALVNGVAVCSGYTEAFNILVNMMGVESVAVYGAAGDGWHSWNKVKLHGEWYNIDVTWDDLGSKVRYNYFNITDSQLAFDHEWRGGDYPPSTATKYNYFVYNKLVAYNHKQFVEIVKRELRNSDTVYMYIYNYDEKSYPIDFISRMGYKEVHCKTPKEKEGFMWIQVKK